jgi:hypothetical protein
MMKVSLKTIFAILIFFSIGGVLFAQEQDSIGAVDTIRVGNLETPPGGKVILPVYGFNDEDVSALCIPLKFSSDDLICDSVSFSGTRVDYIQYKAGIVDNLTRKIKIGMVAIAEPPLSEGSGLLAKIFFSIKESVTPKTIKIDTFSIVSPELFLYYTYTFPTYETVDLTPAFVPGSIRITGENSPPEIQPLVTQYVNEGDSLVLKINASDPNGDKLKMGLLNSIPKTVFQDLGDGKALFIWVPDHIGPYSSENSPFEIRFTATDGELSATQTVEVNVINKNSVPVLHLPSNKTIRTQTTLKFFVSAKDPDRDTTEWRVNGLPAGGYFDFRNPGEFSWTPTVSDTGTFTLSFVASDGGGGTDSGEVKITVKPEIDYLLSAPDVSGSLGGMVSYGLELENSAPIAGMKLLVEYDTTALSLINATKANSRIQNWEYYQTSTHFSGEYCMIQIIGLANVLDGVYTPPLDSGSGVITYLNFRLNDNPDFSENSIPIKLRFNDYSDNTFATPAGDLISQGQITYNLGSIILKRPEGVVLGDLNLNGLSFEIGDAVRYVNYFVNPAQYLLNEQQMFNSDVNEDGLGATNSDLIFLLRYMIEVGPNPAGKPLSYIDNLKLNLTDTSTSLSVCLDSKRRVGGAYLVFKHPPTFKPEPIIEDQTGVMKIATFDQGEELRVLIYSLQGNGVSAGENSFLTIENAEGLTLTQAVFSDQEGNLIKGEINYKGEKGVPTSFTLLQNYPNPFNPETHIDFSVPMDEKISLKIYNIRGQLVKTLMDEEVKAGEHTVKWDGTNQDNQKVASGIYLYRLASQAYTETRRMVLVK